MASSVIHLAVAQEINKVLKKDKYKILIGSIAPDISKLVNNDRNKSHFIDNEEGLPNIDVFLNKYKKDFDDDFVVGYYIHLYTDYLWFKYFITELTNNNYIRKLDGSVVKLNGGMQSLYIYNDYTNLNIELIEKYNLDMDIFYNELPYIDNIIEEIPMNRLEVIVNQAGVIIENSKKKKAYIFDITDIEKFISTSVKLILSHYNSLFW